MRKISALLCVGMLSVVAMAQEHDPDPEQLLLHLEAEHAHEVAQPPAPGLRSCCRADNERVLRVLPRMSASQRQRLARLRPTYERYVDDDDPTNGRVPLGGPAPETKYRTWPGKFCRIHYSTHPGPNQTTLAFAKKVQRDVDLAMARLTRAFQVPVYSGLFRRVLPVYINDLGGTQGEVAPKRSPERERNTVVTMTIEPRVERTTITNGKLVEDPLIDPAKLAQYDRHRRSICWHETMHVMQFYYTYSAGRSWVFESMATWAENVFLQNPDGLLYKLQDVDSPVNNPGLPIWAGREFHQYGVGLYLLHLQSAPSGGTMLAWLKQLRRTDDAVTALTEVYPGGPAALGAAHFRYIGSLVTAYTGALPPANRFTLPKVPTIPLFALGSDLRRSISPTGAYFYTVPADPRNKGQYLFAEVTEDSTETAAAAIYSAAGGAVSLATKNQIAVHGAFQGNQTVVVLTDATPVRDTPEYSEVGVRTYAPYLANARVDQPPPIPPRSTGYATLHYDLLGIPPSLPEFPAYFSTHDIIGPNVEVAADTNVNVTAGAGQSAQFGVFNNFRTHRTDPVGVTVRLTLPARGFVPETLAPQSIDFQISTQAQ